MDNIISESEPVELPELNFGIPQSAEFVKQIFTLVVLLIIRPKTTRTLGFT